MAIFNSFLYVYQRVSVENGSFIDDLPMKMKKIHKSAANSWQMAHFFGFSMFFYPPKHWPFEDSLSKNRCLASSWFTYSNSSQFMAKDE